MSEDRAGHAAPPMPTLAQRALRVLAVVLVFVAVGPPVGGFVFLPVVTLIGTGANMELSSLFVITAFGAIYAVPLSYLIGALPAALTGGFIGLWLAFYGRMSWWVAAATGIVAGFFLSGMPDRFPQGIAAGDVYMLPEMAACLAATLAGFAIVRNWHLVSFTAARRQA